MQGHDPGYALVEGIYTTCFLMLFLTVSFQVYSEDVLPTNNTLLAKYASTEFELFSHRDDYLHKLIEMALLKSGEPFQVEPVNLNPVTESRSIHYLQSGAYTIHWLNTSKQLEDKLLPVRIPLFKGLIGWRLMFVRNSDKQLFKHITTPNQLTKYTFLQGYDWPDTQLLIENSFQVVTSTDFDNLPRMLVRHRGDVFPRSILEIWDELNFYEDMDIVVETNLVLKYPAAYYFFVDKKNTALRDAMEKGLNASIEDGLFDQLFISYFGDMIKRANLKKRTVINLNNTNMSEKTPFHRKELWFVPK